MYLGEPDVEALLCSMSLEQLAGWQAWALLEPFGEERGDLRMGILGSSLVRLLPAAIANSVGGMLSGRRVSPIEVTPADFMPDFSKALEVLEAKKPAPAILGPDGQPLDPDQAEKVRRWRAFKASMMTLASTPG